MRTLAAIYASTESASRVVDELMEDGFDKEDIGLMMPQNLWTGPRSGEAALGHDPESHRATEDRALNQSLKTGAVGGAIGATVGGLGSLLAEAGALTIPGIGPILAAGPLVSILSGATVTGGLGALLGAVRGIAETKDVREEHIDTEPSPIGGTRDKPVTHRQPDSKDAHSDSDQVLVTVSYESPDERNRADGIFRRHDALVVRDWTPEEPGATEEMLGHNPPGVDGRDRIHGIDVSDRPL